MRLLFSERGWADYLHWQAEDPRVLNRINETIKECQRDPFRGLGKPEPLKGDLRGWWSRRITHEDRFVYRVTGHGAEQILHVAQCRYHY